MAENPQLTLKDTIVSAIECQYFYDSSLAVLNYNLKSLKEALENKKGFYNASKSHNRVLKTQYGLLEDKLKQLNGTKAPSKAEFDYLQFGRTLLAGVVGVIAFTGIFWFVSIPLALIVFFFFKGLILPAILITAILILLIAAYDAYKSGNKKLKKKIDERDDLVNEVAELPNLKQEINESNKDVSRYKDQVDSYEVMIYKQETQIEDFKKKFKEKLDNNEYPLSVFPESFRFENSGRLKHALMIVLDGAASDWKTVAQLVRSEEKSNEVVDSINSLNNTINSRLKDVSAEIEKNTNTVLGQSLKIINSIDANTERINNQTDTLGSLLSENTSAIKGAATIINGSIQQNTKEVNKQGKQISNSVSDAGKNVKNAVNAQTMTYILSKYNGAVIGATIDSFKQKDGINNYDSNLLKRFNDK